MRRAVTKCIPAVIAALAACSSCANVAVRFGPDHIDRGLGYWKYGVGDRPIYAVHWLGDSVTVRDGYENAAAYTITASACAGLNEARTKLLRDAEQSVAALLHGRRSAAYGSTGRRTNTGSSTIRKGSLNDWSSRVLTRSHFGPGLNRHVPCGRSLMVVVTANYALERSVRGSSERAAGAQTIIAPAARRPRLARPAQRGR